MQTLDTARETLAWASNRLAEAHRSIDLPEKGFREVLDTYLLASRAYHTAIREINESLRDDTQRLNSRA